MKGISLLLCFTLLFSLSLPAYASTDVSPLETDIGDELSSGVSIIITAVIVALAYTFFSSKAKTKRSNEIEQYFESYPQRETYRKHVMNKTLVLGMTKQEVLFVCGKAKRINTTVSTYGGKSEQWVYLARYLYFENGVLVTIQN